MFKRILSVYSEHKLWVSIVVLLTATISGLGMLPPYLLGRMYDLLYHKGSTSSVLELIALSLLCVTCSDAIDYLRLKIDRGVVWFPIQEILRMKTMDQYFRMSIGQLKGSSVGINREILSTGETSMQRLARMIVQDYLPTGTQFIIMACILFLKSWVLGLVVPTGLLIYAFAQYRMEKKYSPKIQIMRDKNLVSSKVRNELIWGASLIKTFAKEVAMREHYRGFLRDSINTSRTTNEYITLWDRIWRSIVNSTYSVSAVVGIFMLSKELHGFTVGYLVTIMYWCAQMCSMIKKIDTDSQEVLEHLGNIRKFFELLDAPPAVREIEYPIKVNAIAGSIRFHHVSFAYPKKDGSKGKSVVKDVSLYVHAGERVAIVGPSGSGKSTLMLLLQRGFDPDSGSIEIDGNNLRNLSLSDYYRELAVVDQSSLTMDMSIAENILLGTREHLSYSRLKEICQMVELDLDQFEEGLNTKLGESGNNVSGGERQRIAIARALAGDPRILILDEPTASLDAIKEARIRDAIDKASRGRTTITIAHRLVTIQNADRIFLMEAGEITAFGTHRELLRSSGLYMQLVQEQTIAV